MKEVPSSPGPLKTRSSRAFLLTATTPASSAVVALYAVVADATNTIGDSLHQLQ